MGQVLDNFQRRLVEIGAVEIKVGPGKGALLHHHQTEQNAPPSPIYFNLRTAKNPKRGPLTLEDTEVIGYFFLNYVLKNKLPFAGVAGVPNAGDPLAEAFIYQLHTIGRGVPLLKLGKVERKVRGILNPEVLAQGEEVLLINDLTTKGGSPEEAIRELRFYGYTVRNCLVFLEREQGAAEYLSKIHGVTLHHIVTISKFLDFCLREALIKANEYRVIKDYLKQNSKPSAAVV